LAETPSEVRRAVFVDQFYLEPAIQIQIRIAGNMRSSPGLHV
jgi:hypothetical protein